MFKPFDYQTIYNFIQPVKHFDNRINYAVRFFCRIEREKTKPMAFSVANKKHTGALNNSIQALNEATHRLNLKLIIIFASTFVAVMMVFILAIFLYVPSKDEIDERRADMAVLKKYPLQIRESDGETLVRIMTKKCYSFEPNKVKNKTYDWCRIDPKKY